MKRPGLQVRSTEGYVSPRGKRQQPQRRPSTVLAATWDAVASGSRRAACRCGCPRRRSRGKDKEPPCHHARGRAGSKLNLVEQDGAYRGVARSLFAVTDAKKKRWPIYAAPGGARAQARDLRAREPRARCACSRSCRSRRATISCARPRAAPPSPGASSTTSRFPTSARLLVERSRADLVAGERDVHLQPARPDRRRVARSTDDGARVLA